MFDVHVTTPKGQEDIRTAKTVMSNACTLVLNLMPEGREKNSFRTKIEEAMFYGARAIASKEGNFSEVYKYGMEENK